MERRPRTSYGCAACRRRKVKCDEARPRCGNCVRLSSECTYRDTFDVLHRDQTHVAGYDAQKKWRTRTARAISANAVNLRTGNASTLAQNQVQMQTANSRSISNHHATLNFQDRALRNGPIIQLPHELGNADWPNTVFIRFRYDFLDPPDGTSTLKDMRNLVPKRIGSVPVASGLNSAITAAALANYAARTRATQFFTMAQAHYVQAVANMRESTARLDQVVHPNILISAHFLSLYEVLSKPIVDLSYSEHLAGSETMLEHFLTQKESDRDTTFVDSALGIRMLKHTLLRHLAWYKPLPQWLERCLSTMKTNEIDTDMMQLSCAAVNLCADMKRVQVDLWLNRVPTSSPPSLVAKAKSLSSSLQSWKKEASAQCPELSFKICPNNRKTAWVRDLFTWPGAPSVMDVPQSSKYVHEYNIYPTVMLNLQCCVLDLVDVMKLRGWTLPVYQPEMFHTSQEDPPHLQASVTENHDPVLTETDLQATVSSVVQIGQALLQSVANALGIQPPSPSTNLSHAAPDDGVATDGNADPSSPHQVTGVRGYVLFWPIFNLLKSLTRPAVRYTGQPGIESFCKHLLQFFWLELGIAQAEGYRRWFEDGLPLGF